MARFFSINQLKTFYPYLILLYISMWQANSLLKIDNQIGWVIILSNFAFYFFLASWKPILLKILLIPTFFLSAFIYPTLKIYQHIDPTFLASILYTNTGESFSYIETIPFKVFINLGILLILTIILWFSKIEKAKNKWIPIFPLAICIFLPFLISSTKNLKKEEHVQTIHSTYISPIRYGIYLVKTFKEVKKENDEIIAQAQTPDEWNLLNKEDIQLKKNIVIVVGESVRRDFLHFYGFPIENTPFIDSSNHISFNHFISVATHTVITLKRMLAYTDDLTKAKMNNSVINLAKKMGYKTYWISNQGYIGLYDSPISIFAKSCDENFNLNGGDYTKHRQDIEMLPIMNRILQEEEQPKIIFLHMIGSHPSPCSTTNGKYDEFFLSDQLSCYSKTIKKTDQFLHDIYQSLLSTNESYSLIYFSDHGTVINENLSAVHGDGIMQAYDIPFFIWDDQIQEKKSINALRNAKDFIHLFNEFYGVKTANIQRNYRFISEDIDSTASTVVNFNNTQSNYYELENNPIPQK